MINGLDLFSGIGGLGLALENWVRPVAYCGRDPYAQALLLSRMRDGSIPNAGVWDDVRTLNAEELPSPVDIIVGGFPCQDISVAGAGKGLGGERSGLFFEIVRLTGELRPRFVFLENVPAITVRGLDRVLLEFTALGYDCRWTIVSAAEVGAPHLRERWFLLAHTARVTERKQTNETDAESARWEARDEFGHSCPAVANSSGAIVARLGTEPRREQGGFTDGSETAADAQGVGRRKGRAEPAGEQGRLGIISGGAQVEPTEGGRPVRGIYSTDFWAAEPDVGRMAYGVTLRVDRLRGLGNAVVPLQAQVAFKRLMGLAA